MPNSFFRFRQFTVHQERAAMKVCTDACLFGAWVAHKIQGTKVDRILDIGTGTGLLSLMLAQATAAEIDAVEIDGDAASQASDNFAQSPWSERLHVYHSKIQDLSPRSKYDLIISNPPFYENDLRSPDAKRNIALHSSELTYDELLSSVDSNMSATGIAFILVPFEKHKSFEKSLSNNKLHTHERIFVRQSPKHDFFRVFYFASQVFLENVVDSSITIKNSSNEYTDEFKQLLNDYYL